MPWTVTTLYGQLILLNLDDIYQLEVAKRVHNFHSNRNRLFATVSSVHAHQTRSSTYGQYFCHQIALNLEKDQSGSTL